MNSRLRLAIGLAALGVSLLALRHSKGATDCPPDRPIKRLVTDYTRPITCTLALCVGKLVCPANSALGVCYLAPENCNQCIGGATIEMCFTKEEIDDAEQR